MPGRFGQLITAMVTPFDSDNNLDLGRAQELANWLVDNGSDGLVLAGSTGEAATLSDDEKVALWQSVAEAVGHRAHVIAGTGTYDTAHSIHLSIRAAGVGVEALLLVTPYYNRPPQSGLKAHFEAIAGATDLPVILYDIPARSARKIEHPTIIELAQAPNIVALKDACGDAQGAARVVRDAPSDFDVYSGNDGDTLPWLSVGAVGVISVASHVVGLQMAEMISLFHAGDASGARKIHNDLISVFDVINTTTTNPIPVKAALEMLGQRAGHPRLPLVAATSLEKDKIRDVLTRAGVL